MKNKGCFSRLFELRISKVPHKSRLGTIVWTKTIPTSLLLCVFLLVFASGRVTAAAFLAFFDTVWTRSMLRMLTFPALAHMVQQMAGGDVQTLRMAQSILKFSNGFNATHGVGNALVQISWNRWGNRSTKWALAFVSPLRHQQGPSAKIHPLHGLWSGLGDEEWDGWSLAIDRA